MNRLVFSSLVLLALSFAVPVSALSYGEGTYGSCQYGSCSISVASNGSIALDLPFSGGSGTCSVGSDTVTVSTLSSTGYSLYVSVPANDTNLNGNAHGGDISRSTATEAVPAVLSYSSWGYRIDGENFGNGPTAAQTGGAIPSVTFAGVPGIGSPSYVTGSTAAANPAVTDVWLGVCVDTSVVADTYTNSVVYTAQLSTSTH